jgi:DNA/RNA-binding domain of Phe-tRNA-synthetase-like protein
MYFAVAEPCVQLGLRAGAVVFRGLHITDASSTLRAEIVKEAEAVRACFAEPAAVRAAPEIARYQEILRQVGVNPRREQNSVERLLTFALKRGDLPAINSLVDAYNLVSVRSRVSLGAHDLERFTPPATLRLFTGQESFTPLGRTEPVPVTAGEFGYVDGSDRVLCRLDVLQADFSKVTLQTRDALLIVEGTVAHGRETLQRTFVEAVEVVTRHCGGTAEIAALPEV